MVLLLLLLPERVRTRDQINNVKYVGARLPASFLTMADFLLQAGRQAGSGRNKQNKPRQATAQPAVFLLLLYCTFALSR